MASPSLSSGSGALGAVDQKHKLKLKSAAQAHPKAQPASTNRRPRRPRRPPRRAWQAGVDDPPELNLSPKVSPKVSPEGLAAKEERLTVVKYKSIGNGNGNARGKELGKAGGKGGVHEAGNVAGKPVKHRRRRMGSNELAGLYGALFHRIPHELSEDALSLEFSDKEVRVLMGCNNLLINDYDPATGKYSEKTKRDKIRTLLPMAMDRLLLNPSDLQEPGVFGDGGQGSDTSHTSTTASSPGSPASPPGATTDTHGSPASPPDGRCMKKIKTADHDAGGWDTAARREERELAIGLVSLAGMPRSPCPSPSGADRLASPELPSGGGDSSTMGVVVRGIRV